MHKILQAFKSTALIWFPVALLGILLDQLTKQIVVHTMMLGEIIPVVSGFNVALVHNYGSAFGFLNQGEGFQQLFFVIVALAAMIGFTFWLSRIPRKNTLEGLGIALLLSGAVGNLIDRLCYGYVIDFLDFYIQTWHWYAFNLADSFICLGAVMAILQIKRK